MLQDEKDMTETELICCSYLQSAAFSYQFIKYELLLFELPLALENITKDQFQSASILPLNGFVNQVSVLAIQENEEEYT